MKSTWFDQLFDNVDEELDDSPERLGARDAATRSIVEDPCATIGPFFNSFVHNFRAGFNKSVSTASRAFCIETQFYAEASVDGLTLHFLKRAVSDDQVGSTKSGAVFKLLSDLKVIEL